MLEFIRSDEDEDDIVMGEDTPAKTISQLEPKYPISHDKVAEMWAITTKGLTRTHQPLSRSPQNSVTRERPHGETVSTSSQDTASSSGTQEPAIPADMPVHPVAAIFPMMSESELQEMAKDIKKYGLQHPILTSRGVLIDGRNRLKACQMAGVAPTIKDMGDLTDERIITHVFALNLTRRHLDETQRASIAARLVSLKPGNAKAQLGSDPASCGISVAKAAQMLDVHESKVERMRTVQKISPEVTRLVDEGAIVNGRKLTSSGALAMAKGGMSTRKAKTAPPKDPVSSEPPVNGTELTEPEGEQTTLPAHLDVTANVEQHLVSFKTAWDALHASLLSINDAAVTKAMRDMLKQLADTESIDSAGVAKALKHLPTSAHQASDS